MSVKFQWPTQPDLVFSFDPDFGLGAPMTTNVVVEESQGGTEYAYRKGRTYLIHELPFAYLPVSDYDGGFHYDTLSQVLDNLDPWTESNGGGVATLATSLNSTDARTGKNCLQLSATGYVSGTPAANRYSEYIPVDPTQTYYLEGYAKAITGALTWAELVVKFFDSTKTTVGTEITTPGFNPTSTYAKSSRTVAPADFPANTAYIQVACRQRLIDATNEGSVVWDDIVFRLNNSTRNILFNSTFDLPLQSLLNWFYTLGEGPLNTFTYVDRLGVSHTVRFADNNLDFKLVAPGLMAGTIKLKELFY